LSLEDDLLRIFGSQRVSYVMDKLKIPEGEPIEHGIISRAIENAQKKVEGHNFDIRKHLLEYDDVMNRQREVIYNQRREVLGGEKLEETYQGIISETVEDMCASFCPDKTPAADWDWYRLREDFHRQFNFLPDFAALDESQIKREELEDWLKEQALKQFAARKEEFSAPVMEQLMRVLLLQTIDTQWKDHLLSIDHLKEGIGLRGYGQKNPKQEYKREAYGLFMEMMGRVRNEVLQKIFHIQMAREEDVERMDAERRQRQQALNRVGDEDSANKPVTRDQDKVGRNEPCPCGSGKKYKRCCGQ